jgi:hypothetical protein
MQQRTPFRRAVLMLVASAGLALAAAACGGTPGTPQSGSAQSAAQGVTAGGGAGHGSGPVSLHGGSSPGGERSAGTSFSLALAKCMRAHGVPKFPDPDSKAGQLGPGSGVDPASQAFQAAINGPCRRLAPPAWVSSGQVSGGS